MGVKDNLKVIQSIIAAAGTILFGAGLFLFYVNPLFPFLIVFITVPMTENNFVLDIIRGYREQRRFAWREKAVQRALIYLLLTIIFTWVVIFLIFRAKFGSFRLF